MEKKKVATLIIDKMAPMNLFGPVQVFNLAFKLKDGEEKLKRPDMAIALYECFSIGEKKGLIKTNFYGEGIEINVDYDFDDEIEYDILLIPGGGSILELIQNDAFIKNLEKLVKKAKIVLTVGLGAVLLAATSLVNGIKLTSTKLYLEEIVEKYPEIKWTCPARWVVSEKEDTCQMIVSSAGLSAGIDAALEIVSMLDGPAVAENAAFIMEYTMINDPVRDDPFGFSCPI